VLIQKNTAGKTDFQLPKELIAIRWAQDNDSLKIKKELVTFFFNLATCGDIAIKASWPSSCVTRNFPRVLTAKRSISISLTGRDVRSRRERQIGLFGYRSLARSLDDYRENVIHKRNYLVCLITSAAIPPAHLEMDSATFSIAERPGGESLWLLLSSVIEGL